MFQVLAAAVFAILLARVVRAPAGTWRWVVGAAGAALVASQLLPEGNIWRQDVAGSTRMLFWLGLGLAPVAAYAVVVAAVRRRVGTAAGLAEPAPPPRPRGLVRVDSDAALAAETAAASAAEDAAARSGARLSLGWRGEDGAMEGHVRLCVAGGLAEVEMLRVAPPARRRGVGRALLRAAEGEARALGALRIGALVGFWQAPGFFAALGYAAAGGDAGGRRWMEKPL